MQTFIGTKIIKAKPMLLGEYNTYRSWDMPKDEDPCRAGFLVEYEDGYQSWSPDAAFAAYRPTNGMNFGLAIEAMKQGKKVSRAGWNGKDMFIVYMPELNLPPFNSQESGAKVNDRTAKHIGKDTPLESQGYFAMFTAQKKWQPGWLASQADMLSDDWMIV
jgi:hypothetical protein